MTTTTVNHMNMHYTKYDATHSFSQVERKTKQFKIKGIDTDKLIQHSKLCKYNIYKLYGKKGTESAGEIVYGILETDLKTYWCNTKFFNKSHRNSLMFTVASSYHDPKNISTFYDIDSNLINIIKSIKPTSEKNGIVTYFLQRSLWPQDQDIISRPVKKIEYEAGYQLFLQLGDNMIMTHQKNILNYQVDMIFELRNSLNLDIPAIGVEINEDGHSSYDKKNEEERKKIIEYFDNIMFEINIKRGSSVKQIKEEVKKVSEIIKIKANNMLIMNNPDISVKELEKKLLAENHAANLVAQFLANHNTGDPVFCLRHDIVGDFLGITKGEDNYKSLRHLIAGTPSKPSRYIKNIDYKVVKLKSLLRSGDRSPDLKNGKKINDRGKAAQTQIILFNRATYHTACIQLSQPKARQIAFSFAKMYDIIIKYLEALRKDSLNYNKNTKMSEPFVKKRVKVLAKQSITKTKTIKYYNEMNKYKDLYEEFLKKSKKHEEEMKTLKETNKDLIVKISGIDNINKSKNKYKKLYKEEKISRDKLEIELSNTKLELQKLKDEIKILRKERETYKERLKVYEEKAKKKPLVQKYLDKIKKYKNKIKDKIKQIKLLKSQKKVIKKGSDDPKYKIKEHKPLPALPTTTYTVKSLMKLTVVILKGMCKTFGIKGHSKKRKAELVDHMLESNKLSGVAQAA